MLSQINLLTNHRKDEYNNRCRQHLGACDLAAEAEGEDRIRVEVDVGIRAKPVDRWQQVRRQDDARPSVRRKNGGAETDVGVGVHLRKEEQSTSGKSKSFFIYF